MMSIAAGEPLKKLIALAYQANLPLLLHGRHGVGKSEIFAQTAQALGIGFISVDLSLMESVDLIGLPVAEDGWTSYRPPQFLRATQETAAGGLLLFEELNRSPRYMQAPCLQLLTARTLHEFHLPRGWLPCAAINDAADGYDVDVLDSALLSRFLQVQVEPDVSEWLQWTRGEGASCHTRRVRGDQMRILPLPLHRKVVDFVEASPHIFAEPASNPRSWSYVSQFLSAWEADAEQDHELFLIGLSGLVDDQWALAFSRVYHGASEPLKPEILMREYPSHRQLVKQWVAQGNLGVVDASLTLLKRHLTRQENYDRIVREPSRKTHVETFLGDLPADLRGQITAWLQERGYEEIRVKRSAARAKTRRKARP